MGATFIQYIPIIERTTPETLPIADAGWGSHVHGRPLYRQDGSLVTHRSVGPELQMFDTALANWYGEPGAMCVHAETCGQQMALEHTPLERGRVPRRGFTPRQGPGHPQGCFPLPLPVVALGRLVTFCGIRAVL